jgi:hypothetical protein
LTLSTTLIIVVLDLVFVHVLIRSSSSPASSAGALSPLLRGPGLAVWCLNFYVSAQMTRNDTEKISVVKDREQLTTTATTATAAVATATDLPSLPLCPSLLFPLPLFFPLVFLSK